MKTNITAGGIVINPEGKILVVNQNRDSWSLPKGRVEGAESLLETARREIYEETGLKDLQLVREFAPYKRFTIALGGKGEDTSTQKTIYFFLFRARQGEQLRSHDPDNPEVRWVDRDEVADLLTHPKDAEFFRGVMAELPEK